MTNQPISTRLRQTTRLALLIVALLITPSFGFAQTAATQAPTKPTIAVADPTSDFTLANGLKVIHRPVTGNEVVAVQVYFMGGTRNIDEKNAGIESLLFDLAQQGTKSFSKGVINRDLARLGTVVDSGGGYDFSVFAMRCVQKNFNRSWELVADMIANPLLDEKELALLKDQTINALRQQNDSPDAQVAIASNKLLYATHPYANSPEGTVESISRITVADLKAHHAKILTGSRMLVVVVGNITLDEVKRRVEASFGKLPKGDFKNEPPPSFAQAATPGFEVVEKGVATNYIRGTFAAPRLNDPDYPAFTIATNILQQLLFQEVRVKRNLSYSPEASALSNTTNSAFIALTTPKPNEAIQVTLDQVKFLQRQILLDEPLRAIIAGFLTQYYTKLETNDAQAAKLAEYEIQGGDWRRTRTWIDEINRVTPEDINRVSQKYFRNFHFAVIGDAKQFDRNIFLSR